jgi:dolichol-phosphate mannosyltransferase
LAIENQTIAVVIPAYRAARTIADVIDRIPDYVDWVIIVNDRSPDDLDSVVRQLADPRIIYKGHEKNLGVGGAMATGYRQALELGADLIAKIDADGQMDPYYLDRFAMAAIRYGCDYVKANRFGHIDSLPQMPRLRLFGNLALTILTKFVSGYWNVFDPQNGYVMITRRMLKRFDLTKIDPTYFFENSMLINLNIVRAKIGEIYLPAHYGNETSSMRLGAIVKTFPIKLFKGYVYRLYQKYIFRSVSPYFLMILFGVFFLGWSVLWGGFKWYESWAGGIPATTGAVMLALLPFLLGWSLILQAIALDVHEAGPCLLFDYDDEDLAAPDDPAHGPSG